MSNRRSLEILKRINKTDDKIKCALNPTFYPFRIMKVAATDFFLYLTRLTKELIGAPCVTTLCKNVKKNQSGKVTISKITAYQSCK